MNRHVTVVHIKSKKAQAKLVKQLQPIQAPSEQSDYNPPSRLNPLALARHCLGNRLTEDANSFRLDGRGVNLDEVMQAANRVLHEQGLPQLTTSPDWVYVPPG